MDVIGFEVLIPRLMESYHYRHHFANGEVRRLVFLFNTGRNQVFFPCREGSLAEVVNIDENRVKVIHAQVLMQAMIFLNDEIATLAFSLFLMRNSG